jgi:hypothetical protein
VFTRAHDTDKTDSDNKANVQSPATMGENGVNDSGVPVIVTVTLTAAGWSFGASFVAAKNMVALPA